MMRLMLCFATMFFLLIGCSSAFISVKERLHSAFLLMKNAKMKQEIIETNSGFEIFSGQRFSGGKIVTIYIEGDGFAWKSRFKPSKNPTPTDPIALKLAIADDAKNILYLARPCQFVKNDLCKTEIWTTQRFSNQVILATNQAIDFVKKKYGFEKIRLVGFSGGGAVATILSATRKDIVDLRTVAGNLDHKKHSQIHQVFVMQDAPNPIDFVKKLQKIPQIHFSAELDKNITKEIYNSFYEKFDNKDCIKNIIVRKVDHNSGWIQQWRALSKTQPTCN